MARSAFAKNVVRSITGSLGRFLAIMGIVALGCGFYAGLQMCGPHMRMAANKLYDGTALYDLRLVSSMGFSSKDIQRIRDIEGVAEVMPSATCDVMARMGKEQLAMRIGTLDVAGATRQSEQDEYTILGGDGYLNRMFLYDGSWPCKPDECVVCANKPIDGAEIGKTVEVLYGASDLDDVLAQRTFRIVGLVSSPSYPYTGSFGSTNLGSGSIGEYVYVLPGAFAEDASITEAYVRVDGADAYESGSEEYEGVVGAVRKRIESQERELAQARLGDVRADAQSDLDERRVTYENKKADAQKKLDDAQRELADAKKSLDEGKTELEQKTAELEDGERAYADGEAQLASSRQELVRSRQQLDASKAQLEEAAVQLERGEQEWESGRKELLAGLGLSPAASLAEARQLVEQRARELEAGSAKLKAGIDQADEGIKTAREGIAKLQEGIAALDAQVPFVPEGPQREALAAQRAALVAELVKAQEGVQNGEATLAQLQEQLKALPSADSLAKARDGIAELEQSRTRLDSSRAQLEDGQRQLAAGEAAYESGARQVAEAEAKLRDSKAELEDGRQKLREGAEELEKGQRGYEEGLADYTAEKSKAKRRFAKAERKLEDAQQTIDDLEPPDLYLLDRSQNEGVESHFLDSQRIDSIADVFPFMFFLVAALVAFTTMTRMVDDARIEIGTFKALGYSTWRIAGKFLWYAGAASVVGATLGIAVLSQVLPVIVTSAYSIIYTVPVQMPPLAIDPGIALVSGGLGVVVTLLSTYGAVVASLREVPATLMLPRAPTAGKRILLERVGFVWRRLSFSWKVTFRNMFRYKKRLAMTVIGISGCTALLLVGFGLRDSIWDVIDGQYGPIQHYDTTVGLNSDATSKDVRKVVDYLTSTGEVANIVRVQHENMQAGAEEGDVSLIRVLVTVPQSNEEFHTAITFRDRMTHESVAFDDDAVVVTEKLAARYGVGVGNKIILYEQDDIGNATGAGMPLIITGVTENYVNNIVYVGKRAWKRVGGKNPVYSSVLASTTADESVREEISDKLHEFENVSTVVYADETIRTYRNMLSVVDMVVVVLIVSAGLLAFIVLYNLTNINISERVREIASLKVLGFTKREVYAYIFREIVLLSVLGDALGMVFGILLENFVVTTAEVDQVMFGRAIHPASFAYAFAITLAFTLLILFLMRHKLDKVNMVESLKSVD